MFLFLKQLFRMLDSMGLLTAIEKALVSHIQEKNKQVDDAFRKAELTKGDTSDIDKLTNELPAPSDQGPSTKA